MYASGHRVYGYDTVLVTGSPLEICPGWGDFLKPSLPGRVWVGLTHFSNSSPELPMLPLPPGNQWSQMR
mgnify:CR=1 FL=1